MSNLPRPESARPVAPRPGPSRPPLPHQIARALYGSAFDATEREEVQHSMWDFRKLNQKDQLFIVGHLLYLNLQAEAGTQRTLAGVHEVLRHIAGATYTIADEVSRPRLEAEYEAAMAAEAAEAENAEAGFQADPGPVLTAQDDFVMEESREVALGGLHPLPEHDAGGAAAAVLSQRSVLPDALEAPGRDELAPANPVADSAPSAQSARGKSRNRRTASTDNQEGVGHAG